MLLYRFLIWLGVQDSLQGDLLTVGRKRAEWISKPRFVGRCKWNRYGYGDFHKHTERSTLSSSVQACYLRVKHLDDDVGQARRVTKTCNLVSA